MQARGNHPYLETKDKCYRKSKTRIQCIREIAFQNELSINVLNKILNSSFQRVPDAVHDCIIVENM